MNKVVFKINFLKLILTAWLIWLSFSQLAYANLVQNPFFAGSATTATNWTSSAAGTGAAFNSNTRAVNATITAAGGSTEFYSGCVGAACLTFPFVNGISSGAQQSINTVVGTSYTLSFWTYYGANGATTEVDVYWGNTKVYGAANVATGWSLHTVNLGSAASTTTALTVLVRDDPSFSAITYMDVEPVVLQLAKTNPASLVVGVAANYSLTVSNNSTTTSGASFTLQDQLPPNIAFNSAAAGAGITSVTGCSTSGAIGTGLVVTCTVNATGGIAPSGSGMLTLNVTPQAASAGVASTNKASVQANGGVANVAGTTTPLPGPATPSTCTGTDTPTFGCAVATSITPALAQLTFTKTVTLICDSVNGITNPKNIPGAIVRWTMTVVNSGITPVNLTTVTDLLSANTTFDSNLVTGAGGTPGCNSSTGTPESVAGKGFKLSIVGGSRPAASYPKFFTTAADADAASLSGSTVTINYALGLPLEGTYTAGQLNSGESVTVYFNVTLN